MMQYSESRKEAARLTPHSDTQDISTTSYTEHQDATMHETGKTIQVAREIGKLRDRSAGAK